MLHTALLIECPRLLIWKMGAKLSTLTSLHRVPVSPLHLGQADCSKEKVLGFLWQIHVWKGGNQSMSVHSSSRVGIGRLAACVAHITQDTHAGEHTIKVEGVLSHMSMCRSPSAATMLSFPT